MNHNNRQSISGVWPVCTAAAVLSSGEGRAVPGRFAWRQAVTRTLAGASLVLLAACQTPPGGAARDAATGPAAATPTVPAQPDATPAPAEAPRQAAMLAIYLADTEPQDGWAQVNVGEGTLYVRQEPVVTREHLVRIQAGRNQEGEGLLALDLSEEGQQRVLNDTTDAGNKRLALVVDNTMLAAPTFNGPVRTGRLIFPVGTEQNAAAAARAVAGAAAVDTRPADAGARP